MKATGIIRKIDDLGRIVIPKEIRKTLRIKEGDPMEIYVEKNGEIVLKRYAPLGDLIDEAINIADVLEKNTGFLVYVTDTKRIISVSNKVNKTIVEKSISDEFLEVLEERKVYVNRGDNPIKILEKDNITNYTSQIISPIICDGDVIGSVVMFSDNKIKRIMDMDIKIIQMASQLLSK